MQALLENTRAYGLIENERSRGELSHAYLLLFDDARNLRFALQTFAKLFFDCDESESGKRRASLIENGIFSDCLFYPEDGKKFAVEDAERILEESALKPVEGDKKAFVITRFDEATPAAQNKLLKLLEEPPEGVIFLLGACTAYPVLSTVRSRVKTVEIPPLPTQEIVDCLARNYGGRYEMNDYKLCAAAANGCMGNAQNMLEGGAYGELITSATDLCLATPERLPMLVKTLGETKRKKELLSLIRLVFRDALLIKSGLEKNVLLQSEINKLQSVASAYSLPALLFAQKAASDAEKEVTFNAYFPQCIELLIARVQAKNGKV